MGFCNSSLQEHSLLVSTLLLNSSLAFYSVLSLHAIISFLQFSNLFSSIFRPQITKLISLVFFVVLLTPVSLYLHCMYPLAERLLSLSLVTHTSLTNLCICFYTFSHLQQNWMTQCKVKILCNTKHKKGCYRSSWCNIARKISYVLIFKALKGTKWLHMVSPAVLPVQEHLILTYYVWHKWAIYLS